MDVRTILLSQYPACLLLAILFFINYLIVRKRSAVKSILWVLLFGVALAASILCCFLGIQSRLWTLKTLFRFKGWSYVGLVLVLIFLILRLAHGIERKYNRHMMEKALKKAAREKDSAVAEAREVGRQEGKTESEVAAKVSDFLSDAASAPAVTEPSAETPAKAPAESAAAPINLTLQPPEA